MHDVILSDEFDHPRGQFTNYDSYYVTDRLRLRGQKHVDLRSFDNDPRTTEWRQFDMSQATQAELNGLDQSGLEGTRIYRTGEDWTAGTLGIHADRKNWHGLTLECGPGVNSTESVISYTLDATDGTQIRNRFLNPSFESGLANWATSMSSGITGTLFAQSDGWAGSGSYSARVTGTNAADTTSRRVGIFSDPMACTPGETLYLSAKINIVDAAASGFRMYLFYYQADGVTLSAIDSQDGGTLAHANVTGVRELIVTGTVPADATTVRVRLEGLTNVASDTIDFYADNFLLKSGTTAVEYFDGDRPRYRWEGLPHASASSGPYAIEAERIDLLTDFTDDDYFSVALPDFPLADVATGSSYVDVTSNENGDFTVGPTVSIALTSSLLPMVEGDSEFRVRRSSLDGIDLGQVTGIRFRINAVDFCTVKFMAVRLLAESWLYSQIDIDTRLNILKSTVAPNGDPDRAYEFTMPTLFRAGTPAGADDPKPIDLTMAVTFNTGQKAQSNSVALFFRETNGDFTQQTDINGKSMGELNGNPQPNHVNISFRPRTQAELDVYVQSDLYGDTQEEIGKTVDPEIRAYLTARMLWTYSNTSIYMTDSENTGYSFHDIEPLALESSYIFIVELRGGTMRGKLHKLDTSGTMGSLVYDTGLVIDPNNYARRPGRFGWTASLVDGDAYVEGIRSRSQTYAEIKTAAFESHTPVEGATLSVVGTEPNEYAIDIFPADFRGLDATVTRDTERALSEASYRIENPGMTSPQGVMTNLMNFYDFNEMNLSFDIFYPSQSLQAGQTISAFLSTSQGRFIPLSVGDIVPDTWHRVNIALGDLAEQTGRYRLNIVQNTSGPPSVWWIDNVRVKERVLSWYGRSVREDPWGDANIEWVPFRNTVNEADSGVQFLQRGNHLQVLGKAHRQSAVINSLKVTPIYAQMGRPVWEEDELYLPRQPVADFTHTATLLRVDFDATPSYDPDGEIINYTWAFGDGYMHTGPKATHTYRYAGTYYPSLTVVDANGLRATKQITMTLVAT